MRVLLCLIISCLVTSSALAQLADVTYSVSVISAITYATGCNNEGDAIHELKAYVSSWDNINATAVSTGCMACTSATSFPCTFTTNFALQTRSNNSYTISSAIDTWEDDCGDACTFDAASCGTFGSGQDGCRRQLTQSFNFRETAAPTNGIYTPVGPWGTANSYTWVISYIWKYSGNANLLTPACTQQSANALSGAIRSWSVQLESGATYQFATCGATDDTYLRLFGPDGYTIISSNDNNGTACSGNAASLTYTAAASATYYLELSKSSRLPLTANTTLTYQKSCCINASDCNDNNVCTIDACNTGSCSNTIIAGCCQNDNVFQQHLGAPLCGVFNTVNVSGGKYVTFDVISGESYTFSTCNSSYNTRLNGYDAGGNLLFSNDDNGPMCATNRASIVWTATFTNTLRLLVDSTTCLSSATQAVLQYKNNFSIAITSSAAAMCPGEQRMLIATPVGGAFSGTGVSGNTFTAPAGGGTFTITYTLGNCFATQDIPVTNCNDNSPCTIDACNSGACTNTAIVCTDADSDPCTNNKCVNGTCATVCANNLPPQILWQKTYGGTGDDAATAIEQTPDGGYVAAGYTYSNNGDVTGSSGDYDYWLVKTDAAGTLQWQNTFGGLLSDKAYALDIVTGGGYILAGEVSSVDGDVTGNHGDVDFWVVKVNTSGNLDWQKSLGANGKEIAQSIQQTADGGFIVAGKSNSTNNDEDVTGNHGYYDMWVVKLDAGGNLSWQKSYGGSLDEQAYAVRQTPDGGYIVSGEAQSNDGDVTDNPAEDLRPWVVKLDATGNIQWQKVYGTSTANDEHFDIEPVGNDGYILSGVIAYDYWLARLDAAGNVSWENYWGGGNNDFTYAVTVTNDGDYLVAGKSASNNGSVSGNHGSNDYWVIRVSDKGTLLWQKSLGGSDLDDASSVIEDADGNILVAGATRSSNGDVTNQKGVSDFWVVKLTASGCVPVINTATSICSGDSILFAGNYLKNAGTYQHTFISSNSCDSVVSLTLSVSNSCYTITGKIVTETNAAITGVTVSLTGSQTKSVLTASDGLFSFTVLPGGNYTITPSKANDITTNNGVTTADISLVRKQVLSNNFFTSPYKVIAADGNNSSSVSTADITFMRRVVLNNTNTFPITTSPLTYGRLWDFVCSDQVFSGPPYNPFPFIKIRTYGSNITTNQTNQDFIGVKVGDVNGNWNPAAP